MHFDPNMLKDLGMARELAHTALDVETLASMYADAWRLIHELATQFGIDDHVATSTITTLGRVCESDDDLPLEYYVPITLMVLGMCATVQTKVVHDKLANRNNN